MRSSHREVALRLHIPFLDGISKPFCTKLLVNILGDFQAKLVTRL
jgi:hypothetical protein